MEERNYCVYIHINKINGKVYIGQTCQDVKRRWLKGRGYDECPRMHNAIKKYGWDGFEHKILFQDLSLEEANQIESDLIEKYHSRNPKFGYNIKEGGSYGSHSEETRKKIGEAHKGEKHPLYGKHPSQETIKKMSESHKGLPYSVEAKKKTSKTVFCIETQTEYFGIREAERQTGICRVQISSCCQNISSTAGGYHWCYAEDYSCDMKLKRGRKRPVICIETGEQYESVTSAGKSVGIDYRLISKCCNHKCEKAGEYHWKYLVEETNE